MVKLKGEKMFILMIIATVILYVLGIFWMMSMNMRAELALIWPITIAVLAVGIIILMPLDIYDMLVKKKGEH